MKNFIKVTVLITVSLFLLSCDNNDSKAAAFIERSHAYESQGQYRAAMIEIRNAIKADPDNSEYKDRYAEILLTVGATQQAIMLLESTVNEKNKILLADAYLKVGKYLSAQSLIDNINITEENKVSVALLDARREYLSGNVTSALAMFETLATSYPDNLHSNKQYIEHLINEGQLAKAKKYTIITLEGNRNDTDLLYYGALISYQTNDLVSAEDYLTRALSELPDTDMLLQEKQRVLKLLSEVLTQQGRTREALVYNKVIREANPEAFLAQKQYRDALDAASKGDLDIAKASFEDILTQFPNNQQAAQLLGLINLETGELESAEALLSENIDVETSPVTLIRATAIAQTEMGKVDEAIAVLERALLARPDDATLLSLLGVISLNNMQPEKGIKALSKALQLEPTRSRLHLLLAQHYNSQQKPALALGHLRKSFAQVPDDIATTGYYLNTLISQDELAESKLVISKLQKELPNNNGVQFLVAITNYRLGAPDLAAAQLETLYKKAPTSNNVVTALAQLYAEKRDYNNASALWLKAFYNDKSDANFINNAVNTRLKIEDRQTVTNWLMQQANWLPEIKQNLHEAVINIKAQSGDISGAKALLSKYQGVESESLNKMRILVLQTEAISMAKANQFNLALPLVESALAMDAANQRLTVLAAQLDAKTGSSDQALKRLNNFIATHENSLLVVSEKAKLIARNTGPVEALEFIKPYWTNKPSGQLATAYLSLTKKIRPEDYHNALLQLNEAEPKNAGALMSLGDYALSKNEKPKAVAYYEQALDLNGNLLMALNNLAWMISESRPEDALRFAKKAAELAPNNGGILDTYGWILYLQNRKQDAINVLEKANRLLPDNSDILHHLQQAKS